MEGRRPPQKRPRHFVERTLNEEKLEIKNIIDHTKLNHDSFFYLIESNWWRQWKQFVLFDQPGETTSAGGFRPGTIQNQTLLEAQMTKEQNDDMDVDAHSVPVKAQIRRDVVVDRDFVLVPKQVWEKFSTWYGGGPAIARKTVSLGIHSKKVELWPVTLNVFMKRMCSPTQFAADVPTTKESSEVPLSLDMTFRDARRAICSQFSMPPHKSALYLLNDVESILYLVREENLNSTLSQCGVKDAQVVYVVPNPPESLLQIDLNTKPKVGPGF